VSFDQISEPASKARSILTSSSSQSLDSESASMTRSGSISLMSKSASEPASMTVLSLS